MNNMVKALLIVSVVALWTIGCCIGFEVALGTSGEYQGTGAIIGGFFALIVAGATWGLKVYLDSVDEYRKRLESRVY